MLNWSLGEGFVMCVVVPVEHCVSHILAAVMLLKLNGLKHGFWRLKGPCSVI